MAKTTKKALSEFVSEAQENIEALEKDLIRLEDTRRGEEADPDILNAVFRAAHSLKGLSSMFGVERMAKLAHALEDRLDDLRMGRRGLDEQTLKLLPEGPALFARIIAEVAAEKAPAGTVEAAAALAERLRAPAEAGSSAAADPLDELDLDPAVRGTLTEYEEHRLRANVSKGRRLFRIRVSFELTSFDRGLEDLKGRLKGLGEVVSTLPTSDAAAPDAIAFDILFGSEKEGEQVREAAGPSAGVEEVPRRRAAGPEAVTSRGAQPAAAPVPAPRPAMLPMAPAAAESRPQVLPAAPPPAEADASLRSASQAVRVDIHKLDHLMNLVGELVLVKSSLLGLAERLRQGEQPGALALELHRETRSLDRKLSELQGGILEVRMVPLGQIFDKLSRLVRKLARDAGKEIDFRVQGSEVELDKLIVEDLSDPLMHLIRNALDHAIEAPEVRLRGGKPAAGRLTLSAIQKGSHVQILVEDDGAGIDEGRVREVAVERGLATAEEAQQLSRRDALNLIFLPGFSTAKQVTALSGRGVGMDVVKNNIAAMSGIIDLHTTPGKGTRFEITLPVTLAIIRALIVNSAERTYALPLSSVLEILSVGAGEVKTIETREVISLRGATLPLVRLADFFATAGAKQQDALFVVVVGLAQDRLGVVVEGLVGQQDVVVKPLGKALRGIRGISGATDLGNRRTVLVLDVGAIIGEVVRGERAVEAVG